MERARLLAYLLLTLAALFWAGSMVVGRVAVGEVPPLALNFWRWVVALVVVLPVGLPAMWRRRTALIAQWRLLTVLALLNMTVFGTLLFVGLQFTGALNGSLMLGTMPINIVLVSWLVAGAGITGRAATGVVLGFSGLVAIVTRGDPAALAGLSLSVGDLLIWLAYFAYALYSVWLPRANGSLDVTSLMTAMFLIGALTCLPLYLWETFAQGRPVPLSWDAAWTIGYLGVFPSLLAQMFWAAAVPRVGARTAGYFIYLAPVFGTLMAVALLGEAFAWYHAAGIALIFAGIYIATQSGGARR